MALRLPCPCYSPPAGSLMAAGQAMARRAAAVNRLARRGWRYLRGRCFVGPPWTHLSVTVRVQRG